MMGRHCSMEISWLVSLLWMMMETSAGWGTGRGTHSRGRGDGGGCRRIAQRRGWWGPGKEARWVPVVASGLKRLGSRYGDWMWMLP